MRTRESFSWLKEESKATTTTNSNLTHEKNRKDFGSFNSGFLDSNCIFCIHYLDIPPI